MAKRRRDAPSSRKYFLSSKPPITKGIFKLTFTMVQDFKDELDAYAILGELLDGCMGSTLILGDP
ncbi:hypothetical protein NC652_023238 [Populus alba x Populus x berolinensis]|nr:hypothetical protein NC652_023238 [Populus alba x Populus x berolinensis]